MRATFPFTPTSCSYFITPPTLEFFKNITKNGGRVAPQLKTIQRAKKRPTPPQLVSHSLVNYVDRSRSFLSLPLISPPLQPPPFHRLANSPFDTYTRINYNADELCAVVKRKLILPGKAAIHVGPSVNLMGMPTRVKNSHARDYGVWGTATMFAKAIGVSALFD